MNVTVLDRKPETISQSFTGFIDCDVHPFYKSADEFDSDKPLTPSDSSPCSRREV